MSLLDLAYIIIPPVLALAIAAGIVWTGNRSTEALDAEIAAYRARKDAEKAAQMAEEVQAEERAPSAAAKRAFSSLEEIDDLLRRVRAGDNVISGVVGPMTVRAARELLESAATLELDGDNQVEGLPSGLKKIRPRKRAFTGIVRLRRDVTTGQTVMVSNPPYFPSRSPTR